MREEGRTRGPRGRGGNRSDERHTARGGRAGTRRGVSVKSAHCSSARRAAVQHDDAVAAVRERGDEVGASMFLTDCVLKVPTYLRSQLQPRR